MKIGLLTTSYPRVAGDYAGSFVGDRVSDLLAEGHVVDVLAAADATSGGATTLDGSLTITRLPAVVDGHPPLFYGEGAPEALERGGAAVFLAAARFSTALASEARVRARGWDAIESHWLVPSALAALAAAPALPRRAYAHSGDVALLERAPFGRAIARCLVREGTDFRFVSAELRERFAALAGTRVGTVEPLAPPPALFPRRRLGPDPELRLRLGLRTPTLLSVGRLVPIKGHAALLRACARVKAEAARAGDLGVVGVVSVVILGDGPERARLGLLARELGVPLRLPGFVPRHEVAHWLAAADVFVQPSLRLANGRGEGAPLAMAEARAVGIPIVVESDPRRLVEALRTVTAV